MSETYRFIAVRNNEDEEEQLITLQERPHTGEHIVLDETEYLIRRVVHQTRSKQEPSSKQAPKLVLVDPSLEVDV